MSNGPQGVVVLLFRVMRVCTHTNGDWDDSNGTGATSPAWTATSVTSSRSSLSTRRVARARTRTTNGASRQAFASKHVMTKWFGVGAYVAIITTSVMATLACPSVRSRFMRLCKSTVRARIRRTRVWRLLEPQPPPWAVSSHTRARMYLYTIKNQ